MSSSWSGSACAEDESGDGRLMQHPGNGKRRRLQTGFCRDSLERIHRVEFAVGPVTVLVHGASVGDGEAAWNDAFGAAMRKVRAIEVPA